MVTTKQANDGMIVRMVQSFLSYVALAQRDIDEEYDKMLEDGLSYGMTIKQFWESDLKGYILYSKAYLRKIHRETHLQGLYFNMAIISNLSAVLGKKGSEKIVYPEEDLMIKSEQKKELESKTIKSANWIPREKVTKDNLEEAFTQRMLSYY